LGKKGEGGFTTSTLGVAADSTLRANSEVVINSRLSGIELVAAVGHEGSHVADAQDVVKSIQILDAAKGTFKVGANITRYQSEQRAYRVTDTLFRSANESGRFYCGANDCILGRGLRLPSQLSREIDRILANSPLYRSDGMPLAPSNEGGSVVNGLTVPH